MELQISVNIDRVASRYLDIVNSARLTKRPLHLQKIHHKKEIDKQE